MTPAAPTPFDRITTLDTVRGVAVMGILLLNIVAFSMPETAYMNPRAYGGADGIDLGAYLFNFVLFDGKMRGLFSFLFGASMLLVIERAESNGLSPARIHFARMFWLFVFGLAHLWLVWWGDILNLYALVGMIAFAFRNTPVHRLVIMGVLLLLVEIALISMVPIMIHSAELALQDPATAKKAAKQLAEFNRGFGVPPQSYIAEKLAEHRGSYEQILEARWKAQRFGPITGVLFVGAETLAYMLFGMAALRCGLLTGAWPRARYVKWLAIGFGIGIPVYVALAAFLLHENFSLFATALTLLPLAAIARPPMIVGWACLIILLARPGGALTGRVAATGRMAFSNYLLTSVICTTIFYGYGLGWFGYLSRAQIYLVVPLVWALMLLWSKPWLAHFRYGPLEWLWRSLARGRFEPIRGPAAG